MLKHVKSLIAVALAVLVTVGAALWLHNQSLTFQGLRDQRSRLEMQLKGVGGYPAVLARTAERSKAARLETEQLLRRFAKPGQEEPLLVNGVTRAATASGLDMINAARAPARPPADDARPVKTTSYNLSLRGGYPAAARFFQNLAAGELLSRMDSMEIHPPADEDGKGVIQMDVVISVFSSRETEKQTPP
jgi:Tfp pilus assembly protein PilO